jgi:DNA mismatch repair protein MutL
MSLIRLLPDHIANQIAAGEVVQRPASVVKELLENAVDAGAQSVRLLVKDAGRTLIQVTDDGCGMSEADARLCFERHATSKISQSDDLFNIRTMGFRGEALASIAAVAQVELRTRRVGDELGTRVAIEASEVREHEPCQAPVGTTFLVKNLFHNVPARRNFLKANPVEMRHILDEFQRVALAYPEVFFSLHHNGVELFNLPKGNLRQRLVGVLGQGANKKLVPIEQETEVVSIRGFVGKPEFARKTRGEQFFFVNNRFIKSSFLHHAVVSAFEGLLPADAQPLYSIYLELDPARIDVNVHPTKQEIKFDDEKVIYQYLRVSVKHALGQFNVSPTLDFEQDATIANGILGTLGAAAPEKDAPRAHPAAPPRRDPRDPREDNNLRYWEKIYEGLEKMPSRATSDESVAGPVPSPGQSEGGDLTTDLREEADFQVISSLDAEASSGLFDEEIKAPYQIHHRYIVTQVRSGFLLIDQQAAHERILYERYLRLFDLRQPPVQGLLFPVTLNLSVADAEMLRGILPEVNALGVDVREFGGQTFVVHGLPPEFRAGSEEQLIDGLLEQCRRETDLKLALHERLARSLARQGAVKRGQEMGMAEMTVLVDQLFACEMPFRSPYGRKCFITLNLSELDKQFDGA